MFFRRLLSWILTICLVGCTAYSTTENVVSNKFVSPDKAYASKNVLKENNLDHDVTVILAFSGGGTRAAALSYGVMQTLRDTYITINGKSKRLLDEVDVISSVSGGSFTSAYYGLYGDKLFTDYPAKFLYKDVEEGLLDKIMSLRLLFSRNTRTEKVIEYYQEHLFHHKTFADIRKDSPLLIINATDLGSGVRFSFLQEYFDLICSDLNTYPIASAVTASSAVPVVFSPIALKNRKECSTPILDFTQSNIESLRMRSTVKGLQSYADKDKRPYIHLVDGGITDNLGLLALNDIAELSGGREQYLKKNRIKTTPHLIIISVDASTYPEYEMDKSNKPPSAGETVSAMTDIQLHRYNDATKVLAQRQVSEWVKNHKVDGETAYAYFVDINLQDLTIPSNYRRINDIPTSLTLDKDSVDILVKEGRNQLEQNPKFQQFLLNLKR